MICLSPSGFYVLTISLVAWLFLSNISMLRSPITITSVLCKSIFDMFSNISIQLVALPCGGLYKFLIGIVLFVFCVIDTHWIHSIQKW